MDGLQCDQVSSGFVLRTSSPRLRSFKQKRVQIQSGEWGEEREGYGGEGGERMGQERQKVLLYLNSTNPPPIASFTLSFIIPCHFRLIIIHVAFSMQMSPLHPLRCGLLPDSFVSRAQTAHVRRRGSGARFL